MNSISIRLPEEQLKELERIGKIEHLDRTTLMKQLLEKAIKERKLDLAYRIYLDGVTLEKAAEILEINLWEMMEYIEKNQLTTKFDEKRWEEQVKTLLEL